MAESPFLGYSRFCFAGRLSGIAVLFMCGCIASCASAPPGQMPLRHEQHCDIGEGVSLLSNAELRIGLGQRPSAGYGIELSQHWNGADVSVHYHEIRPGADALVATVITTPCVALSLPDGWQKVEVHNSANGQRWHFRSEPVSQKRY